MEEPRLSTGPARTSTESFTGRLKFVDGRLHQEVQITEQFGILAGAKTEWRLVPSEASR